MRLLSATSSTPFVDTPAVNAGGEGCYININNSNSNSFSANRYSTKKSPKDLLEADLVDPPVDDTIAYSMLSFLPTAANTGQLQGINHKPQQLKNQISCSPELEVKTQEQQEPYLLPDMFSKNIFNSQASMFVYSNIPKISSVQSFMGAETSSYVTDACSEENILFVGSKIGISLDHSVREASCYDYHPELASSFSVRSAAKLDLVADLAVPTASLETVVDSKKRLFEIRQQHEIETFNSSYQGNILASMFLNHSHLPLVRGRSSGGYICKPPKELLLPGTRYVNARLRLENSSCEDMCLPEWDDHELEDSRRIVRIERRYHSNEIVASFSIVGSAKENPRTKPSYDSEVKVLEFSCLRCLIDDNKRNEEQYDSEYTSNKAQHDFSRKKNNRRKKNANSTAGCQYYITSVEVIKIIELLVGGSTISDPQHRRKERGRVRSNLAQFWSKHLVSSSKKTMKGPGMLACNDDYLAELEQRINTYDVRKPRLFDKSVKILEWSNLGPALQRAIQSYYMVRLEESSK